MLSLDRHKYLQATSCHHLHRKEGIPYSQILRLNHICFETKSSDKRFNDLKRFLLERGFKWCERELRQARAIRKSVVT